MYMLFQDFMMSDLESCVMSVTTIAEVVGPLLGMTTVSINNGCPRPKLKLCLFHLTRPTHENTPVPKIFIHISF